MQIDAASVFVFLLSGDWQCSFAHLGMGDQILTAGQPRCVQLGRCCCHPYFEGFVEIVVDGIC